MAEYNEVEIRAASGLHEDCLAIIQRHIKKGARVIDLAAGAGAFSARLVDHGFDVTANDIDDENWQPTHIPKLALDLDEALDPHLPAGQFAAVIAMEVIEHLQNPSKLLDDCRRLVAADGVILLSTPNVSDIESRLIFLRSGFFYHISPQSYHATGHRTVLPSWLLELFIDKAGLEVVEKHWGGKVPSPGGATILHRMVRRAVKTVARLQVKAPNAELDSNYLIYLLRRKSDPTGQDID